MTPPPLLPAKTARRENRWLWVPVIVVIALPVLLFAGILSCFSAGSETEALRARLSKSCGIECQPQIVLRAGGLMLGAVRTGLAFAPLETEARAALNTVRGVEFGLYRIATATTPDRPGMLAAADEVMRERGWYRASGVINESALVAVYVPENKTALRDLKCCVVVLDDDHLILAATRVDPRPLLECLWQKQGRRDAILQLVKG